ncbi:MAG: toll/interleukin-1 receptor domain-containing protein [Acidobacteria bacterium]|nr:toll/interleukin-1 receptor domain-containing protein [Acidobacteriota bacterium]MBV9067440.1 toll/interleukin-1 receptor domain-containing protein [Acidobacteriota bacterium]MBV9187449.1 toll/interleukin-1 receptor domain-containing protein [Acidobacteriota bacterium]
MANPEHVAKLKEGWEAWNAWRETSDETPDLSGVNLVSKALDYYQLSYADFSGAFLDRLSFYKTICHDTSFEGARLYSCAFIISELINCNFVDVSIRYSTFDSCSLAESDLTGALLSWTAFANTSFRSVRGLGTLGDLYRNSIGIDTFFQSGGLPESFLRGSGVPEEFIEYASSLVGKAIEYYSCFLSYSSKDDEFARRLYNDLQGKNVRTWFAPEDLKTGDRFRSRIDESIRFHDKLVIILSENSVNSDWVATEVESALEREQKEGKDVLFPIAIDEEGFTSTQPWAADIRRKRHIGDFRKWKSHDDYTAAFDRLVRDLKKSQPPIIMKGG